MNFYTNLLRNNVRNLPTVSSELNLPAVTSLAYLQYQTGIRWKPRVKIKRSNDGNPHTIRRRRVAPFTFSPKYSKQCWSTYLQSSK